MNNVSTKKQLDVHIISFDQNANQIKRNYTGSEFIGHGDAETVVKAFKSVHGKLDYVHDLTQISMDEPNVNWKIDEVLKQQSKEDDLSSSMLLELGNCGLHVLHRAYQTDQYKSDWNLDKVLRIAIQFSKNLLPNVTQKQMIHKKANEMKSHKGKCRPTYFYSNIVGVDDLRMEKQLNDSLIYSHSKQYFEYLTENKKFPRKDDRFVCF